MEPPVRLYNSNGAGGPRKRAARTSKRTATAEARHAARAVRTSTPSPAVTTPAAEPIVSAPAPEVEVAPQGDAGPVVGIADFEEIFTRFQTPITNFVFRLVGNREQAYDLTQDVFVKAYRALSSGTTIQAAALSSWLYRIDSNTATYALRRPPVTAVPPCALC